MRLFVTGASGFIGSAVVAGLQAAGHEVTGLARSQASADLVFALGAQVQLGSLADLDSVRAAAAESEGVIHLAYRHGDPSDEAAGTDRQVIETLGDSLAGSDRPLVVTSGTLVLRAGRVGAESDVPTRPRRARRGWRASRPRWPLPDAACAHRWCGSLPRYTNA